MTKSLINTLTQGVTIIEQVVATLLERPGVYRMLNEAGDVLYVGKAKNLKKRVSSYTKVDKLTNRLQRMVSETSKMEIVVTQSEIEALLLESNLIKHLQPRYNILLKDDKAFPKVLITTSHDYPSIIKHRGPQTVTGRYFGPFASSSAVDECLVMLQKVFLLRNCSDSFFEARTRPCLQYHIKRCSAPCVNKISKADYRDSVKQAVYYLSGKTETIQKHLADKMMAASERLAYEEAAGFRDRIRLFARMQAKQRVNVDGINDADVIAACEDMGQTCFQVFFFRGGQNFGSESFFLQHTQESGMDEKMAAFLNQFYTERPPARLLLLSHAPCELTLIKAALKERHNLPTLQIEMPQLGQKFELVAHALNNGLQAIHRKVVEASSFQKMLDEVAVIFDLPQRPERIEVYDNSHIQGTNPYGVMIVTDNKGFNKKAYRKFAIKGAKPSFGGDDYAMMREVLQRRFARSDQEDWTLPDLMLIDGGQGQLNVVMGVVQELGIDNVTVVAIAKGPDRNAGREKFFMAGKDPMTLPENTPLLHFLQRLRDEAHRFAIGTHRAGRQRALIKSRLDEIPGIGPARKKALLQHFGSVKAIAVASFDDILRVEGVNKSTAKTIYQYFHES